MKKFVLPILLCVALLLCSCGAVIEIDVSTETSVLETSQSLSSEASEEISEEVSEDIKFTANDTVVFLGDSIASGYGLENEQEQRYSTLIQNSFGCTAYNYAVAGDDGEDLINLLKNGGAPELAGASAVVLSIGANNVLYAAGALEQNASGTLDITEALTLVTAGIDGFRTQLPEIINLIRQQNADARIVFQTVYNPYKDYTHIKVEQNGIEVSFAAFCASCVLSINGIIEENAAILGYTVCDIYTPFKESEVPLVNATADGSNPDPHPNADGHELIAQLISEVLK